MENESLTPKKKFASKTEYLEGSTLKYACTSCWAFSTEDPDLLTRHFTQVHHNNRPLSCLYCCVNVKCKDMVKHIDQHFLEDSFSKDVCKMCDVTIDISTTGEVLSHIKVDHDGQMVCPICLAEFAEADDLYYHVNGSIKQLYHCKNDGCLVMSHHEEHFKKHLEKVGHDHQTYRNSFIMTCLNRKYTEDCCTIGDHQQKVVRNSPMAKERIQLKEQNSMTTYTTQYSQRILKKLFSYLDKQEFETLSSKMEEFGKAVYHTKTVEGKKVFLCSQCTYSSEYSSADVRKHLMAMHCDIEKSHIRECVKCSKIDPNQVPYSEKKMIEQINHFRASSNLKTGSTLPPLSDSEEEDNSKASNQFKSPIKRKLTDTKTPNSAKKPKPTEIVLAYSDVALEHFVKNKRQEHRLDELRAKMQTFCTFTAKIVTEGASKFVQCSSCPELKHRGIYEFTKHVMVKHASIPTALRDIARMSCRMDRRYRLLSDQVLLDESDSVKENIE